MKLCMKSSAHRRTSAQDAAQLGEGWREAATSLSSSRSSNCWSALERSLGSTYRCDDLLEFTYRKSHGGDVLAAHGRSGIGLVRGQEPHPEFRHTARGAHLCTHFGIGMNKDHTLEEVGQQFSLTRKHIRHRDQGAKEAEAPYEAEKLLPSALARGPIC
jgi:hypothetical protein